MKKSRKALTALVEVQKDGFSAYLDIEGHVVASTGDTLFELKENILDAFSLFLETAKDLDLDVTSFKKREIELRLDVKQVFEIYKSINISGFASYSGINRSLLNQYAKGIKIPSEKQSVRILKGLHSLGKELTHIHAL